MIRATVLSIVIALAAGPGGLLCCGQWFHAATVAASGCDHDSGASGAQVGHLGCQYMGLGVLPMLKEADRRGAPADGALAIPVASHQIAAVTSHLHVACGTPRAATEGRRPLAIPLRI